MLSCFFAALFIFLFLFCLNPQLNVVLGQKRKKKQLRIKRKKNNEIPSKQGIDFPIPNV